LVYRFYDGEGHLQSKSKEFLEAELGIPSTWFSEIVAFRSAAAGKFDISIDSKTVVTTCREGARISDIFLQPELAKVLSQHHHVKERLQPFENLVVDFCLLQTELARVLQSGDASLAAPLLERIECLDRATCSIGAKGATGISSCGYPGLSKGMILNQVANLLTVSKAQLVALQSLQHLALAV